MVWSAFWEGEVGRYGRQSLLQLNSLFSNDIYCIPHHALSFRINIFWLCLSLFKKPDVRSKSTWFIVFIIIPPITMAIWGYSYGIFHCHHSHLPPVSATDSSVQPFYRSPSPTSWSTLAPGWRSRPRQWPLPLKIRWRLWWLGSGGLSELPFRGIEMVRCICMCLFVDVPGWLWWNTAENLSVWDQEQSAFPTFFIESTLWLDTFFWKRWCLLERHSV